MNTFCNSSFGEKLHRLVMLEESAALQGAELGRIHAVPSTTTLVSSQPHPEQLLCSAEERFSPACKWQIGQ